MLADAIHGVPTKPIDLHNSQEVCTKWL